MTNRCPYSYYDRTAYCNICDLTGKQCDGYLEKCNVWIDPYGEDNDDS